MAEARVGARGALVRIAPVLASDDEPHWMGDSERRRWATLAAGRRPAFATSRRLLRDALAQATGVGAASWQVSAVAGTAPEASRRDVDAAASPHVSLSHRLGWVAAAVGREDGGPIGVDIECDRPSRGDPAGRAALAMPAGEYARWLTLDPAMREPALLRAWVAREAWVKAAGGDAPWDFRRLACEPCEASCANVRLWEAGPLRVALCTRDPGALAGAACHGWPEGEPVRTSWWHVSTRAALRGEP